MLQSSNLRVLCSFCLVWIRARLILMPSDCCCLMRLITNTKKKYLCNRFGNIIASYAKEWMRAKKKSQPAKCQTHSFTLFLLHIELHAGILYHRNNAKTRQRTRWMGRKKLIARCRELRKKIVLIARSFGRRTWEEIRGRRWWQVGAKKLSTLNNSYINLLDSNSSS